MTYMMSSAQNLITQEGAQLGGWQAHLMIYQPFITAEAVGLSAGFAPGVLFVENPGKPLAALRRP